MPLNKRMYQFIIAVVMAVVVVGAVVAATGGGDNDQPITGPELEKCSNAALAEYPDGTVTETELGDNAAAYGVEIRLADGSQVEVNLDENCVVISQEADDDGPKDD